MKEDLRVLILEDLPSDAELAKRELKTVLKNYTVKVVDTEEDFIHALKIFKPNLIISDYLLPEFDGLSALNIRQDKCPFTPFVMLTGSINEDTAVECIKAGADDYVIKEHIKRLGPAVISALENKKIELQYKRAEEKARESYYIINRSPAVVFLWKNAEGWPVEYVSDNVKDLFGYTAEEFMSGKVSYTSVVHPDDVETVGEEVSTYSKDKKRNEFSQEYRIVTKDTKIKWIDDRTFIRRNEKGEITHYQGIAIDITERKEMISDLMNREEKYRTLTQNLNVGVYRSTSGKNGMFVEVNPAFLKMFEFRSKSELERFKVEDFYSDPFDREKIEEKLTSKGFLINEEVKLRKKDGTRFSASISATAAKDDSGKVIHYDGIIEDITEEKKAREDILNYQSDLKSLTNELLVAEEEAKHRLAMTLHDKLGQSLVLAKFKTDELNKKTADSEYRKILNEITSFIAEAINESRNITYELSPAVLYEMGLIPAISLKLDDIEKSNKIKTSLTDQSKSYELETKGQIILFRTISELLQNVIKHSKADKVNVEMRLLKNSYRIIVADNGIGFDLETMRDKAVLQKKFGLFSIMERIKYIGGSVEIDTKPRKGTKVVINLPIKN